MGWIFVPEDPGGYWKLRHALVLTLTARFDRQRGQWKVTVTEEDRRQGYREEWVEATENEEDSALIRALEIANSVRE